MYIVQIVGIAIALLAHTLTHGVSIVYNLRIAETTKRQAIQSDVPVHEHITAGTLFASWRETYNNTHQTINGGLGTFIYTPLDFYFRIDSALGHVRAENKKESVHDSHTQWDDILCMFGYNMTLGERIHTTVSGLWGIPTHKDHNLQYFDFGTGHAGLGFQADAGYRYSENNHNTLYGAARLIHFFPRTATACIDKISHAFDFNLGNLVDLLLAHNSRWGFNKLEIGYNATFDFAAHIDPALTSIVTKTNFIRSSFYGSYNHIFSKSKHPQALIIGLSYSRDQSPKQFGIQRGITTWITWGINF